MRSSVRSALTAAAAVATVSTLAGCAALFGPARDADGRVTESSEIKATALLTGDCFSFIDDADLSQVTVSPCAEEHTYIVLDQGELDAASVESAGDVQNAVSAACSPSFDQFKDAAADGVKPEQEFIVTTEDRDGEEFTVFLCLATDSAV